MVSHGKRVHLGQAPSVLKREGLTGNRLLVEPSSLYREGLAAGYPFQAHRYKNKVYSWMLIPRVITIQWLLHHLLHSVSPHCRGTSGL